MYLFSSETIIQQFFHWTFVTLMYQSLSNVTLHGKKLLIIIVVIIIIIITIIIIISEE
jgi:uncharacterized membrane protein